MEILTAKRSAPAPSGEDKEGADAAEIITAVGGALGGVASVVDSISNAANGGGANTPTIQQNSNPAPIEKKTNPWLVGGLVGGGLLILLLLVFMNKGEKNGRSKSK